MQVLKNKKLLATISLIIWLFVIFFFSNQEGTSSSGTSNIIVDFIMAVFNLSKNNLETVAFIVRKLAHFTEYFVLGLLTINAFKYYIKDKLLMYSIIFVLIYAVSDEIHQAFIPGRASMIMDTLIDSLGGLVGIITYRWKMKLK